MDKVKNLQEKAVAFRALLEVYARHNAGAQKLLVSLAPLYAEVAAGKVVTPRRYEHLTALGTEAEFYEKHRDLFAAEADFVCALEDWESQDWYQQLKLKGPFAG